MPSLVQLEYIVAVDKTRHFGKAAEACTITQPTLSMQIQKVEEEIGYLIFDRGKKPVVLMARGALLSEQAKVLLHESQKLSALSRQHEGEVGGEFRIGVIPTIAPYLLPLFSAGLFQKKKNMRKSTCTSTSSRPRPSFGSSTTTISTRA